MAPGGRLTAIADASRATRSRKAACTATRPTRIAVSARLAATKSQPL